MKGQDTETTDTGMKRWRLSGQAGCVQEDNSGPTAESILEILGGLGLRNTRPRRLIAEQLAARAASGSDFAIEDLWKALQIVDPHIGRATVYRAVDLLQREGVLDRVPFADGSHRYRLCGVSHHHHLTCNRCQRVVEVDACLPPDLLAAVASTTDFSIEGHALELFGYCGDCRRGQRL